MSRFIFTVDAIRTACRNAQQHVEARRKAIFEAAVDKEMERRFFKPKNRQEAEQRAIRIGKRDMIGPDWEWAGAGALIAAKRLLLICRHCEEPVTLDSEDAEFVASYLE